MAAHQYWRALGFKAYDGGALLDLSEFQLFATTTRVDAAATLTSTIAPVVGALSDLKDDATGTSATLTVGTELHWDFGASPQDVTDIRLGAADSAARFPLILRLQWSDDAVSWVDCDTFIGLLWPGVRTKTTSPAYGGWIGGTLVGGATRDDASGTASFIIDQKPMSVFRGSDVLQVEWTFTAAPGGIVLFAGFSEPSEAATRYIGGTPRGWAYQSNGVRSNNNSGSFYGATWAVGDVIGGVINLDAGTIEFFKNGVSQGVAYTGITFQDLVAAAVAQNSGTSAVARLSTGNFTYPVVGATPWEPRTTRIACARALPAAVGASAGSSLGATPMSIAGGCQLGRGALNFILDAKQQSARVRGTVKVKGSPSNLPLKRRVRLIREIDAMLIAEQWSDPVSGAFDFQWVEVDAAYTVISYDYAHNYRAVVGDNLTIENGGVELMP